MANDVERMRTIVKRRADESERIQAVARAYVSGLRQARHQFADNTAAAAVFGARREGGPASAFWEAVQRAIYPALATLADEAPILIIMQQTATAVRSACRAAAP